MINEIRKQFNNPEVKKLLINNHVSPPDYWYNLNMSSNISSLGFCYLASEVYYRLNGGAKNWWFKQIISDKLPYNGHHYFLQHKITNEIIDITADQFDSNIKIPYELGKNKGIRFSSKQCNQFIKILNSK